MKHSPDAPALCNWFDAAVLASSLLQDPEHPGVAAAILGITGQVMQAHYNLADKAKAAHRFHASLREDRKQTQSLVGWGFSRLNRKKPMAGGHHEGRAMIQDRQALWPGRAWQRRGARLIAFRQQMASMAGIKIDTVDPLLQGRP